MFAPLMYVALIGMMLISFLFQATVPVGWTDIIAVVVGLVITLALKFGPIPSRVVAIVGVLAGLYGTFGAKLIGLFPAGSRIPIYIAFFGVVLAAISERIQGGITVPEKRKEAVAAEKAGTTF